MAQPWLWGQLLKSTWHPRDIEKSNTIPDILHRLGGFSRLLSIWDSKFCTVPKFTSCDISRYPDSPRIYFDLCRISGTSHFIASTNDEGLEGRRRAAGKCPTQWRRGCKPSRTNVDPKWSRLRSEWKKWIEYWVLVIYIDAVLEISGSHCVRKIWKHILQISNLKTFVTFRKKYQNLAWQ